MAHVVYLIADPERAPLDGAMVAALERALGTTARWLAADEACELPVDGGDGRAIRARVEAALGNPPCDVGVVPAAARRKRLLVSDMDSTMITSSASTSWPTISASRRRSARSRGGR